MSRSEKIPHHHPRHIAIIMDGNGRWASQRNLPRIEGHRKGVKNVERILKLAAEFELEALTLFAFSSENWNRPKEEVDALMEMLERFLTQKSHLLHEHQIHLNPIGYIDALPASIVSQLSVLKESTAQYPRKLGLALNYGSRLEVVHAVKSYMEALENGEESADTLCWERFERHLYTADMPDPDLIIRTSGETRLSNFLLLQGAYAEIHYCQECWPEFGRKQFLRALKDYSTRERRFGLTGEQLKSGCTPPVS